MNKIYVVVGGWDYDGYLHVKAFENFEDAVAFKNAIQEVSRWGFDYLYIEEVEYVTAKELG